MLILSLMIFCLLALATLIVKFRLRTRASPELSNNLKRIQTWWAISLICIPVFYFGNWLLISLIFVLIIWAAFELSRMENKRLPPMLAALLLCIAAVYSLLLKRYPDLDSLFYLLPIVFLILIFRLPGKTPLRLLALFLYCITSLETLLLIYLQGAREGYNSGLVLLYLFTITALNDIFQYLCGKLFGKRPLLEGISPNKTIEGAMGGILLTGLLTLLSMPLVIHVGRLPALLVGVLVACLGIIGDLSISRLKRQAKVKNSGTSMPGHGGLLDRIDSLALTAPAFGLLLTMHL